MVHGYSLEGDPISLGLSGHVGQPTRSGFGGMFFWQMDLAELAAATGTRRGIEARRAEIDTAIRAGWRLLIVTRQLLPGDVRWLGQFTPRGIPLVVVGQVSDSSIQFFSVTDGSHLQYSEAMIDPASLATPLHYRAAREGPASRSPN